MNEKLQAAIPINICFQSRSLLRPLFKTPSYENYRRDVTAFLQSDILIPKRNEYNLHERMRNLHDHFWKILLSP